jgi:hypothetical protein
MDTSIKYLGYSFYENMQDKLLNALDILYPVM